MYLFLSDKWTSHKFKWIFLQGKGEKKKVKIKFLKDQNLAIWQNCWQLINFNNITRSRWSWISHPICQGWKICIKSILWSSNYIIHITTRVNLLIWCKIIYISCCIISRWTLWRWNDCIEYTLNGNMFCSYSTLSDTLLSQPIISNSKYVWTFIFHEKNKM